MCSNPHGSDIFIGKSCLDEDLNRLVTRRALLVELDIRADVSTMTCLLFESCPRTVLREDSLGMSALISVSVEAAHFCYVPDPNASRSTVESQARVGKSA